MRSALCSTSRRSCQALLLVVVTLGGCADRFDPLRQRLQARCEVHFHELFAPIISPGAFTAPEIPLEALDEAEDLERLAEDPSSACELYVFSDRRVEVPGGAEWQTESALVEGGRWSLDCADVGVQPFGDSLERPYWRSCTLVLDPVVRGSWDDGLLLCKNNDRAAGGQCVPNEGRRTVCRVVEGESGPAKVELSRHAFAHRDAAQATVTAVHTFDGDPGLVAVSSAVADGDDVRTLLYWLRASIDESAQGLRYEPSALIRGDLQPDPDLEPADQAVNVCAVCGPLLEEARVLGGPRADPTSLLSTTRGDGVLLGGVCGARALLEIHREEPRCAVYPIPPSSDGAAPWTVYGVIPTESEEGEAFAALWSDGITIWSTPFTENDGEGGLTAGDAVPLMYVNQTWSRESPDAVCVCPDSSDPDCASPVCLALWTESRLLDPSTGEPRSREIRYDFFGSEVYEGLRDSLVTDALGEGFGGRAMPAYPVVGLLEFPFEPIDIDGIYVYRHESYGIMARPWGALINLLGEDREIPASLAFPDASTQLQDMAETSDFSLTPLGARTYAVAYWQREAGGEWSVGLTVLGRQRSQDALEDTRVLFEPRGPELRFSPGFELCAAAPDCRGEPPRPLAAVGSVHGHRDLFEDVLVVAADNTGGACRVHYGLFSTAAFHDDGELDFDWPTVTPLAPEAVARRDVHGACVPGCSGMVQWIGEGYLVVLPGDEGPAVQLVTTHEDDQGLRLDIEDVPLNRPEGMSLGAACDIGLQTHIGDDPFEASHGYALFDQSSDRDPVESLGGIRFLRDEANRWVGELMPVTMDGGPLPALASPRFSVVFVSPRSQADPFVVSFERVPFPGWYQREIGIARLVDRDDALDLVSLGFRERPVPDSRPYHLSATAMPCEGLLASDGDCALLSVTRPDLSACVGESGYCTAPRFSPVIESALASFTPQTLSIDGDDRLVPTSVPVVLGGGAVDRGFVTDVLSFGEDPHWRLAGLVRFSPEWGLFAEDVAIYRALMLPDPDDPGAASFGFIDLDLRWMRGEGQEDWVVQSLRLTPARAGPHRLGGDPGTAPLDQHAGAVWQRIEGDAEDGSSRRIVTYFGLIQPVEGGAPTEASVTPSTGAVPVGEALVVRDLEGSDVALDDGGRLVAEHLGAAVASLPDDRFVVGWLDDELVCPPEDPECEDPSTLVTVFHAAQVACRQHRRGQGSLPTLSE